MFLLIFDLLLAGYINIRFLPQLKIKGWLVWTFYFIIYLVVASAMLYCIGEINNIDMEYLKYADEEIDYDYTSICKILADTAMMGLGFQIVATMYQITLTLSLMLNELTVKN